MTASCRDQVLSAFNRLERQTGRGVFTLSEIVDEVLSVSSTYARSTVQTHVVSRMCANAPNNHATVYPDLLRVERGEYRRR